MGGEQDMAAARSADDLTGRCRTPFLIVSAAVDCRNSSENQRRALMERRYSLFVGGLLRAMIVISMLGRVGVKLLVRTGKEGGLTEALLRNEAIFGMEVALFACG